MLALLQASTSKEDSGSLPVSTVTYKSATATGAKGKANTFNDNSHQYNGCNFRINSTLTLQHFLDEILQLDEYYVQELCALLCKWPQKSISQDALQRILCCLVKDKNKQNYIYSTILYYSKVNNNKINLNNIIKTIQDKFDLDEIDMINTLNDILDDDTAASMHTKIELFNAISEWISDKVIDPFQPPVNGQFFFKLLSYCTYVAPSKINEALFLECIDSIEKNQIDIDHRLFNQFIMKNTGIALCLDDLKLTQKDKLYRFIIRIFCYLTQLMRYNHLGSYSEIIKITTTAIKEIKKINLKGYKQGEAIKKIMLSQFYMALFNGYARTFNSIKLINIFNKIKDVYDKDDPSFIILSQYYQLANLWDYTYISEDFFRKDFVLNEIDKYYRTITSIEDDQLKYHNFYYIYGLIEYTVKKFSLSHENINFLVDILKNYKDFLMHYAGQESSLMTELLLSNAYLTLNDEFDLNKVEHAIKNCQENTDVSKNKTCKLLYNAGNFFIKIGQFKSAIKLLKESKDMLRDIDDDNTQEIIRCDLIYASLKYYFYQGYLDNTKNFIEKNQEDIGELLKIDIILGIKELDKRRLYVNKVFYILLQLFYYHCEALKINEAKEDLKKINDLLTASGSLNGSDESLMTLRKQQLDFLDGTSCALIKDERTSFDMLLAETPSYLQYIYDFICYQLEALLMLDSHKKALNLLSIESNTTIPVWFKNSSHFIKFYALKTIVYVRCGAIKEASEVIEQIDRIIIETNTGDSIFKVYRDYAEAYLLYHDVVSYSYSIAINHLNRASRLLETCLSWFNKEQSCTTTTFKLQCQLLQAHVLRCMNNTDSAKSKFEDIVTLQNTMRVATPLRQEALLSIDHIDEKPSLMSDSSWNKLHLLKQDNKLMELIHFFNDNHCIGLKSITEIDATLQALDDAHINFELSDAMREKTHKLLSTLKDKALHYNVNIDELLEQESQGIHQHDIRSLKHLLSVVSDMISCYITLGQYQTAIRMLLIYKSIVASIYELSPGDCLIDAHDIKILIDFKLLLFSSSKDIEIINFLLNLANANYLPDYLEVQKYILENNVAIAKYVLSVLSVFLGNEDDIELMQEAEDILTRLSYISYTSIAELFNILWYKKDKEKMHQCYYQWIANIETLDPNVINLPVRYAHAEKIILHPALRHAIDLSGAIIIEPMVLILFLFGEMLCSDLTLTDRAFRLNQIHQKLFQYAISTESQAHWYLYLCYAYRCQLPHDEYLSKLDSIHLQLFNHYIKHISGEDFLMTTDTMTGHAVNERDTMLKQNTRLKNERSTKFIESLFFFFSKNIIHDMGLYFSTIDKEKFYITSKSHKEITISLRNNIPHKDQHEMINFYMVLSREFNEILDVFCFKLKDNCLIIMPNKNKYLFNVLYKTLASLFEDATYASFSEEKSKNTRYWRHKKIQENLNYLSDGLKTQDASLITGLARSFKEENTDNLEATYRRVRQHLSAQWAPTTTNIQDYAASSVPDISLGHLPDATYESLAPVTEDKAVIPLEDNSADTFAQTSWPLDFSEITDQATTPFRSQEDSWAETILQSNQPLLQDKSQLAGQLEAEDGESSQDKRLSDCGAVSFFSSFMSQIAQLCYHGEDPDKLDKNHLSRDI